MYTKYYIYKIIHDETEKTYVGRTSKSSVCTRWSEHIASLQNNSNEAPILQTFWNLEKDITKWSFKIVDIVSGVVDAKHKEAERILEIPLDCRLNTNKTSTITLERRRKVEELLGTGLKYREISAITGHAIGTISKIKNGKL